MQHFYGNGARWITTIITMFMDLSIVIAQMIAVSYVLSNFLTIPANLSLIVSFAMIMGFSLMGGIRTIAQTGALQFTLFFVLFPISYALITHKYGGLQSLSAHIIDWNFRKEPIQTSTLICWGIFSLLPECSSSFVQKCLIAKNRSQLEKSLRLVGQIYIPIMLSLWIIACMVKVIAPGINPSTTLLYYINNICPLALRIVLSVSLIAIIMGMSDGFLHACSVIFANDVVKVLRPETSEKALLGCAKVAIVALCSAAFFFASFSGSIINIILGADSIWAPIILVPLCAGFSGFASDKRSFFASTALAGIAIIVGYCSGLSSIAVLITALLASFIGFFGAQVVIKKAPPSYYIAEARAFLYGLFSNIKTQIIVTKAKILRDLFPQEAQILIGQRQIYPKFCISMLILFFIYAMLMGHGLYYQIMGVVLSIGYLVAALLMAKDSVFHSNNKIFYGFWYGVLIIWPAVSSYGLLSDNSILTLLSALSLFALMAFTNAITYLFSIVTGFAISTFIYKIGIGGQISSAYYLVGFANLMIGYFFLRPQEQLAKEGIKSVIQGKKLELINDDLNEFISFFGDVIKATKTADGTVNMLLDSMKNSLSNLPQQRLNILSCVQDAVAIYAGSRKHILAKIYVDIDESLEASGAADYLPQVILNLVKNSFLHGGNSVMLQVRIYNQGHNLIIEDNGVGIPQAYKPFIFDCFFTKGSEGSGIGLSFCRSALEGMNAAIFCESQTGEGSYTRFTITLPEAPSMAGYMQKHPADLTPIM